MARAGRVTESTPRGETAPAPSPSRPDGARAPARLSPHAGHLSAATVLGLQRAAGNAATVRVLSRRPPAAPTLPAAAAAVPVAVQRSVYLANEDDYIYKSEQGEGEFAYLMKYQGNYPLFVQYDAIDKLKGEPILRKLWEGAGGVEQYFKENLVKVLKSKSADATQVRGHVHYPFLYDGKSGQLNQADLGEAGLATVIAAALTGGAKPYQQGGGSRLPGAVGILTTVDRTREEVLMALGIPKDRWGDYKQLVTRKCQNWALYERYLKEAEQAGSNLFVYADSNTNTYFHYISAVDVKRNANAKIQIAGRRLADAELSGVLSGSSEEGNLKLEYSKLGTPRSDSGWLAGTGLNRKDRGEGQAKAMGNWNALGAAAYANKFLGANYPMDQNWEWLHIQGAQIGGATDSTNLVPGLYVTNSFMIPYENLVEQWARADPTHFWARFQTAPANTLYAKSIRISIKAVGHQMLGDLEQTLVTFDVLGGKVVDKLANEIVKRNIDRRSTVD